MREDQERAAMRKAGLTPIPLEIEPGNGCPGDFTANGRQRGYCITCNRLGGRELAPAVRLVLGVPNCVNFYSLNVPALRDGTHPQGDERQACNVGGNP